MSKADLETSIVNGFHAVLHEVKRIENGENPPENETDLLKMLFHRKRMNRSRRPSCSESWSFFDDIILKYLDSEKASNDNSTFADRLTSVLVAVCLSDYEEFERFVFDIYANDPSEDHDSKSARCDMMNLENYAELLRTILPINTEESTLDEHITSFSVYLSSHPDVTSNVSSGEKSSIVFPKSIAIQYHTKMRKQLLWPLRVALDQVKMKFLGVNYWTGLHDEIAASSSDASQSYLTSKAQDFSSFVATLSNMFSWKQYAEKLSSAPIEDPARSSPDTIQDIISSHDGIFTYRHQTSVGVGKQRYASRQTAVHRHSPISRILKETYKSPDAVTLTHSRVVVADLMLGLHFLIIEDSKLQRKMMRRKVTSTEKECSPANSDSTVFNFDSKVATPTTLDASNTKDAKWTIMEACNGEEAIQMIIDTKTSFDVIFVDENLQHSGGYMLGHEFVKILRGHNSVLPTTVIIGCSANAERYVSDFLASGADAVWKKPMPQSDVIFSELLKYIENRHAMQA